MAYQHPIGRVREKTTKIGVSRQEVEILLRRAKGAFGAVGGQRHHVGRVVPQQHVILVPDLLYGSDFCVFAIDP